MIPFLAAQAATPFDRAAMIILADWLEEQGDLAGAQALRGLASSYLSSPLLAAATCSGIDPIENPDDGLLHEDNGHFAEDEHGDGHGDGLSFTTRDAAGSGTADEISDAPQIRAAAHGQGRGDSPYNHEVRLLLPAGPIWGEAYGCGREHCRLGMYDADPYGTGYAERGDPYDDD